MTTKNLFKGSFGVLTLLLLILIATVIFAVPFLLLDYFFSLEVAFLAYIVIGLGYLAYVLLKRRITHSETPS
ncbi:hypothetical protein [Robiginitalea sp.]|uniref:hypothetical protein n=1 Tax=Robiginitalea sp. TaxID=1902411 RepID=UPI003C61BB1B